MMLMTLKKQLTPILLGLFLISSGNIWADIAVIVHPSNINELSKKQIAKIYLGKNNSFPDGTFAKAIDQQENSLINASFTKKIIKRTPSQLKRYWSRIMFSSENNPPIKVNNDVEVKKIVSEKKSYIGYIDASNVDDSVRVVLTF